VVIGSEDTVDSMVVALASIYSNRATGWELYYFALGTELSIVSGVRPFLRPDSRCPVPVPASRASPHQRRARRRLAGTSTSRAIITSVDLMIASASSPRRSFSSSRASLVMTAVSV
jgi:hypothetical protein